MNRFIFFVILFASSVSLNADSTYQVEKIYQVVSLEYGTIALDRLGNTVDVSQLLVPADLDPGTYKVTVTRKAYNLYKIDGYDYYIKTSLCLELALSQTVYLEISGFSSKITFVSRF